MGYFCCPILEISQTTTFASIRIVTAKLCDCDGCLQTSPDVAQRVRFLCDPRQKKITPTFLHNGKKTTCRSMASVSCLIDPTRLFIWQRFVINTQRSPKLASLLSSAWLLDGRTIVGVFQKQLIITFRFFILCTNDEFHPVFL